MTMFRVFVNNLFLKKGVREKFWKLLGKKKIKVLPIDFFFYFYLNGIFFYQQRLFLKISWLMSIVIENIHIYFFSKTI